MFDFDHRPDVVPNVKGYYGLTRCDLLVDVCDIHLVLCCMKPCFPKAPPLA